MDLQTRTWHLMARALNGEANLQEWDELHQLLARDEQLQQQFDLLSRIWKEKPSVSDDNNASAAVQRIILKAEQRRRPLRIGKYFSIAASLTVIVGLSAYFFRQKPASPEQAVVPEPIIVKNGSRSRSILADGTTVWLNAGSKLVYANNFKGNTREVKLEGEGFFDVVRMPNRPFIVHTSGINIRVLGTAFNVKAYPEDKNVETTLYRGLVNVYRASDADQSLVQLKPNEKLVLAKQAATGAKELSEPVNTPAKSTIAGFAITTIDSTKKENERFETAWLYSRLEFRGDSFEELAHKMERWYNVSIDFADEKVKRLHLNGSFENETVEQAFEALKIAFPITYKINNNEISVGSSK